MAENPTDPWSGSIPAAAVTIVKLFEQFKSAPYSDNPGNPNTTWTIGYGSIVDKDGQRVTAQTPPISEPDAVLLLTRDMTSAAAAVKTSVKASLLVREAAALISWTYNLGAGALQESTMLQDLNRNDKADVPSEMRKWIKQGPQPLLGLLRRRWAEAAIFVGVDAATAYTRSQNEVQKLGDWPAFSSV